LPVSIYHAAADRQEQEDDMKLIRWGRSPHQQTPNTYAHIDSADDGAKTVRENFPGFSQQNNDLSVEFEWSDVRSLISHFARMNHPDAVRVVRMLRPVEDARGAEMLAKLLAEEQAGLAAPHSN
jgi:hypothetical protein